MKKANAMDLKNWSVHIQNLVIKRRDGNKRIKKINVFNTFHLQSLSQKKKNVFRTKIN